MLGDGAAALADDAKARPFAMPIALKTRLVSQRSIANAHAELPMTQIPGRDDGSAATLETGSSDGAGPPRTAEQTNRSLLMGALALAGIAGCVIFKLGSLRRKRSMSRKRRGAIWAAGDREHRQPLLDRTADELRAMDFLRDLDDLAASLEARSRKTRPAKPLKNEVTQRMSRQYPG
jgi:hypothetical protein